MIHALNFATRGVTYAACASLLSGCMAATLVPHALQGNMLVGSTKKNDFSVTFDISPPGKALLLSGNKWAMIDDGTGGAAIVGDVLESRGGLEINLQPVKKAPKQ